MLCQRGCEAEDATPPFGLNALETLPARAWHIQRVVLGEAGIDEGVIGVEQREHAAVILKEVDEEAYDLLLHIAAQRDEGGEVTLALFIQCLEIAHMQPLAAKLGGEAANSFIFQHAAGLRCEHSGVVQLAIRRELLKTRIWCGGPEEVTQASGEFQVVHGCRLDARGCFFTAIEKGGSHEHTSDQHAYRCGMRQLLLAQLLIQGPQLCLLRSAERTTPGASGKVECGLHMPGFSSELLLLEQFGIAIDRFTQRLKGFGIGVLSGELPELLKDIHLFQGCFADEAQFVPQAVDFGHLVLVKHQSLQLLIFTIVQSESHHFICGNDFGVAERGGEQHAEFGNLGGKALPHLALVSHKDRCIEAQRFFAIRPSAFFAGLVDRHRGGYKRGR